MRTLTCILSVIAALVVGLVAGRSETTNAPLTFYIVSDHEIDGGRFIDATNYPKLGYIAAKPDLIITNLVKVYPTKQADHSLMIDAAGKKTVVPARPSPSITIQLSPDDAKQFMALTERAVGKKLLFMLGERPVFAAKVLYPLETPYVGIEHPDESELKKIEHDLKKLAP